MQRRLIVAGYALVAVLWIGVRVGVFSHARPIEYSDSPSFLTKAVEPAWTTTFFFGSGRFFVVPLFYKMAFAIGGQSKSSLTEAQFLLSLYAWMMLAWSLAARFGMTWLGVFSFTAALALGLTTDVIQWDSALLSESVSTSIFVLLMALWLQLAEGITIGKVAAVTVMAAAWSMSREANSLLILPLAVAAPLLAVWHKKGSSLEQILCFALACALITILAGTTVISSRGDRWFFPLLNVIGKRVLPVPERTAFYQKHGMPLSTALRDMSGEFGSGKDWAFYLSPDLADFRAWMMRDGKRVFAKDLVTHPIRSTLEPFADVNEFVCPILRPYWSVGFTPFYPYIDDGWFCHKALAGMIVVASLVLGFLVVTSARALPDRAVAFRMLTAGSLVVGWLPFTWFTWQVIGQMEISRHVWSGVLVFRFGVLLLLLCVVEAAWMRQRPEAE